MRNKILSLCFGIFTAGIIVFLFSLFLSENLIQGYMRLYTKKFPLKIERTVVDEDKNLQTVRVKSRAGFYTIEEFIFKKEKHNRSRHTPLKYHGQNDNFLLFLGCSVTFGSGVNDNETMPFYTGKMMKNYQAYNHGIEGSNPAGILYEIEKNGLNFNHIEQKKGYVIYSLIYPQYLRATGNRGVYKNKFFQESPLYTLENGSLKLFGRLKDRPSHTKKDYSQEYGYRLFVSLLKKIRDHIKNKFPESKMIFVFYPYNYRLKKLIPEMNKSNLKYLDLTELLAPDLKNKMFLRNAHPNPAQFRLVSKMIVKSIQNNQFDRLID